jgi:hypothetical protein
MERQTRTKGILLKPVAQLPKATVNGNIMPSATATVQNGNAHLPQHLFFENLLPFLDKLHSANRGARKMKDTKYLPIPQQRLQSFESKTK